MTKYLHIHEPKRGGEDGKRDEMPKRGGGGPKKIQKVLGLFTILYGTSTFVLYSDPAYR
jgi:hypothetical protein